MDECFRKDYNNTYPIWCLPKLNKYKIAISLMKLKLKRYQQCYISLARNFPLYHFLHNLPSPSSE